MRLNPKYLEVVLLYYYEGYRMKEIAQMLGITEAAVSTRIRKAKQKLKNELEGGEEHEK
jgi:RNA polymerase sigma-70 factor (ECF subfamily)